ncbi:acyl-CoA dehydrogenase family protein [Bordetella trematum]|uniref:acyl-CoA dehydrogenase family protein n=1 Tax=Bordetella trematum TaxID=123899 RepID=UPI0015C53B9C|nr:acyl-CoA dehydrogenase family protein [Bordetella trematum]
MSSLLTSLSIATISAEAEHFRSEVRAFLDRHLPARGSDARARSWMGFDSAFSRQLAARGWVGTTLPRRYGGADLSVFHRFVLVEELLASGAPVSAHWIADRQSGPLILRYGTEAQKDFFLPRICSARAFFCIGMSEPNAGSDLASVTTRATREDGGGWRLNGRKIWTTHAQHCDYMIALLRTSGSTEDRHKGLSQFIIDLRLPGVTVRPIVDLTGDAHFSEVFFDDVALADDALIGSEGAGWEQVTAELAFERSGPERIYSSIVLLDRWMASLSGRPDRARYEAVVGRFLTQLFALRQLSIAVAAQLANGASPVVEAALVKDIGTEFEQAIPAVIEGLLADDPANDVDMDLLRATAYVSQVAPTFSLRGGTREILRGMIARGLGLR